LSISAILLLEYAINHRFFDFAHRKIYLLLGLISKFTQIFANGSSKQIETSEKHFFQFRPQTQNTNFSRSSEKISEKKCASIFSKEDSKESWENTEQKIGLRQAQILKF
jgi:hypothetical protein